MTGDGRIIDAQPAPILEGVAWSEGSACSLTALCAPTLWCNNNQCLPPCPEP